MPRSLTVICDGSRKTSLIVTSYLRVYYCHKYNAHGKDVTVRSNGIRRRRRRRRLRLGRLQPVRPGEEGGKQEVRVYNVEDNDLSAWRVH